MGIYDRDYYRREGYSFLGSLNERGAVCTWLILINVACYVIQLLTLNPERGTSGPFTDCLILDAQSVFSGQVWRLVTYAFLHSPGDIWHIVFNMLFLFMFGRDVEDLYGPREFLAIYLVSAFVGGVVYVLAPLFGLGASLPCLGASGAVTAILVLCAFHFPTRVIYLFFFLPVPIWLFVVFEVAQDAYKFFGRAQSGTAVAAHLGGAAFGFLYYKRHWHLMSSLPNLSLSAWRKRRAQPRLRVYRELDEERPAPVGVTAAPPPIPQGRPDDEQLEAKMDAVLEKISRVGKENLTDSDRDVLRRAAEAIKRRRT
jgi:membrane associated rhomboid family serine protease